MFSASAAAAAAQGGVDAICTGVSGAYGDYIEVQPVPLKELDQLIVTMYTLPIYPFVHNQLTRMLFEG